MPDLKIHVLGNDEIVSMLGLLGIEGTVIKDNREFLNVFNTLANNELITMIIISLDLPENLIDFLIDFKLNRRKPFVFYLPDIFTLDSESKNLFLLKTYESITRILT